MKKFPFILIPLFLSSSLVSQEVECQSGQKLIDNIVSLIGKEYVLSETAEVIVDSLTSKNYSILDKSRFARILNRDLRRWSKDKHFEFSYISKQTNNEEKKRIQNYGFQKIEILNGNIGYLKLTYFEYPSKAKEIAESAMAFLLNTDAIIVDLRNNTGGSKAMVQLILSYFFKEESTHLYSIYGRNDQYFHGYSETSISGKSLSDKPLYLMVNNRTFSASELFAFVLQNKNRATLVGQTTSGGGHTVKRIELDHCFEMYLPVGKVVDPIRNISWENIGIHPNIETDSKILETAYQAALKNKKRMSTVLADSFEVNWELGKLNSILEPVVLQKNSLQKYLGLYGRRIISEENGNLYYRGRKGIDPVKMIPISESLFRFEEVDFFRVQFITDQSGKVTGLKGLYDDGYEDYSERTESLN